jgi:hypothetical protein
MKHKVCELSGRDLDAAVAVCKGIPLRRGIRASNENVEDLKVPFTLYEVQVRYQGEKCIGAEVKEIEVIRYGISYPLGATAPSISFIDSCGRDGRSTVDCFYLSREEAEIEATIEKLGKFEDFYPSTNWAQAGPVFEREGIAVRKDPDSGTWFALSLKDAGGSRSVNWDEFTYKGAKRYGNLSYELEARRQRFQGSTPLVAIMRCYVGSKFGEEIEIPEGRL